MLACCMWCDGGAGRCWLAVCGVMAVPDDVGLQCIEGRVGCGPVCTLTSTWRENSIAGLRRWRGPHAEKVSTCSVPATEG